MLEAVAASCEGHASRAFSFWRFGPCNSPSCPVGRAPFGQVEQPGHVLEAAGGGSMRAADAQFVIDNGGRLKAASLAGSSLARHLFKKR